MYPYWEFMAYFGIIIATSYRNVCIIRVIIVFVEGYTMDQFGILNFIIQSLHALVVS